MRLYIAGPMTGLPEFNYPAFHAAETRLTTAGYETENPANCFDGDTSKEWHEYMRADIKKMVDCDGIALITGWGDSRGARLEVDIANALGMSVLMVDEWIDAA